MQSQTRSGQLQLQQLNEVSKTYEDDQEIIKDKKSPVFTTFGQSKAAEDQNTQMKMEEYAFSTENREENDSPELVKKRVVKEPFHSYNNMKRPKEFQRQYKSYNKPVSKLDDAAEIDKKLISYAQNPIKQTMLVHGVKPDRQLMQLNLAKPLRKQIVE